MNDVNFHSKRSINKHLMTGHKGNSEFCFPETLNVPSRLKNRKSSEKKLFAWGHCIHWLRSQNWAAAKTNLFYRKVTITVFFFAANKNYRQSKSFIDKPQLAAISWITCVIYSMFKNSNYKNPNYSSINCMHSVLVSAHGLKNKVYYNIQILVCCLWKYLSLDA